MAPRSSRPAGGAPTPKAARGPRLLVISGPSGAGKTSLAARLLDDPRFGRALTATTRKPRAGEENGVHYRFLGESEFRAGLSRGDFLEHAEVYGRLYGTPRESPKAVLAGGRHCVLVVDVQGAASIRREMPDAVFVFVDVSSVDELRRRLAARGLDGSETIERRLAVVDEERAQAGTFDLTVLNDDLDRAARQIAAAVGVPDLTPPPPRRGGGTDGRKDPHPG